MTHTSPQHLGIVADVHGNVNVALNAINVLIARGITEIHFLGDFGFMWKDDNAGQLAFKRLRVALEAGDATALVTGGNHENYDLMLAIEPDAAGIRWLRNRIGLLPRGWRAGTPSGTTIASLGGANSIDRYDRKPGVSWWWQESITEEDLAALGTEHADVLLGHDSPKSAALYQKLLPSARFWTAQGLMYSDLGQAMFHRGFMAVTPKLSLGGHYHLRLDTTEEFYDLDGNVFESRAVILDADGEMNSVAILDTETLELEYLNDALRAEHMRLRHVRD